MVVGEVARTPEPLRPEPDPAAIRPPAQARPSAPPGMSAGDWALLAGWKARVWVRHRLDAAGGIGRMERAGARRALQWLSDSSGEGRPLAAWLHRPGAGTFWLPRDSAGEWAAATCTEQDLAIARAAVRGEVDLLGSGPVALGAPPRWRRDLYSGREWPLDDSHRLSIQRGDGSDIRTVWELSRFYHLPALARASRATGDPAFREAFAAQVDSWIEDNPLGRGPHWASPMDAAIRSANWVLALFLFLDEEERLGLPFLRRMLANLYSTGLFLERHLEWHPVYRGNHFVSNGVGLVYLGTLFRGERAGDRWLWTGARILAREILRQVHEDGVSFEASLAYHRLVTEFFAYGSELVRRNLPGAWGPEHEDRLRRMYRFIAAYLPPGGEAPMLGDADDGRLHALSAEGFLHPRRHALGLPAGHWPDEEPEARPFARGGFFVLRSGEDHAVVRCGPVGLNGAGSHDHNDQLSYELVLAGRRIVADSGTYAYTRDPSARFAFRSTAAHSVVQLGGEEQNPIRADRPWRVLADRTRSECVEWSVSGERLVFEGRHRGYAHRPSGALCHRRIVADLPERVWTVEDRIEGSGTETVAWRLHLSERLQGVEAAEGELEVVLPGDPPVRLRVEAPGLRIESRLSEASERYGTRRERTCLLARGEASLPLRIVTTIALDR